MPPAYPDELARPSSGRSIGDSVGHWMKSVDPRESAAGLDALVDTWGAPDVIGEIARRNSRQLGLWARRVRGARCLESSRGPVRTVATYCRRMSNGGLERVASLLMKSWADSGFRVVLICEEPPSDDDYPLPDGVIRVSVPTCADAARDGYEVRARAFDALLREHEIDVVVHHFWSSQYLLWDLLTCKSTGAAFIIHTHGVFSHLLRNADPYFADMPSVYALADGVIVLSDADASYWGRFNPNVKQVVNPLGFDPSSMCVSDLSRSALLWVGRLADVKRPHDAIRVLAKVRQRMPGVTMDMVGGLADRRYVDDLRALARKLGVDDAVTMHGFSRDVTGFYERASVLLLTSEYEGFSLVLAESQAHGVPAVMYEMPGPTIVRSGRGVVQVPMGDMDRAADAVVSLLADHDRRLRAGREARANIEELSGFDVDEAWRAVFNGEFDPPEARHPESERVMWESLHEDYRAGVSAVREEGSRLRRELEFGAGSAGIVRRMLRAMRRAVKRLVRRS